VRGTGGRAPARSGPVDQWHFKHGVRVFELNAFDEAVAQLGTEQADKGSARSWRVAGSGTRSRLIFPIEYTAHSEEAEIRELVVAERKAVEHEHA